ncbi:MAG: hypothetical protein AAGA72_04740 [Pseudomonadota bacterium]
MDKTVLFWGLIGVLGFAFVLAVQMRVMIALVLRRWLKATRGPVFDQNQLSNRTVMLAARQAPVPESAEPLVKDAVTEMRKMYPSPLAHLRLARRISIFAPGLILMVIAFGRMVWETI